MSFWQQAREALSGLPEGRGLNMAYEAVDRHVVQGRGQRVAFRFIGRDEAARDMTYGDLERETNRFANVLGGLGVGPGDAVFTLLGRTPALYVAALGSLKAQAVFSPLFSVFGPEPLRVRLQKGGARVLVTTAALFERKVQPLLAQLPDLKAVIVVGEEPSGALGYERLMEGASDDFRIPPTRADQPALLHFTSGTTGAPKGAVHVHEAVVAHDATARIALDLHEGDIFWCTADPGWVTGVSYGIIAPLTRCATVIVDEAEFDPERWYRLLQDHRVAVWYTAPTAIRMLIKAGDRVPRRYDLSPLRVLASVGEPLNAEAALWGDDALGVPVRDTWWQTETGAIMIANIPGHRFRPGALGFPLPGIEAVAARRRDDGQMDVLNEPGSEAELAIKAGWPSMFRDYLGESDLYGESFAGRYYLTGDLVRRDADGRFWFLGRADDVIKSAGHLIGPYEVESVLLSHPTVSEVGVIGVPDAVVGETVKAFVTLKAHVPPDEATRRDLLAFARQRLGASVAPREIMFRKDLPMTRSGKIMRRLLKSRELGLPDGDNSMLADTDDRMGPGHEKTTDGGSQPAAHPSPG